MTPGADEFVGWALFIVGVLLSLLAETIHSKRLRWTVRILSMVPAVISGAVSYWSVS